MPKAPASKVNSKNENLVRKFHNDGDLCRGYAVTRGKDDVAISLFHLVRRRGDFVLVPFGDLFDHLEYENTWNLTTTKEDDGTTTYKTLAPDGTLASFESLGEVKNVALPLLQAEQLDSITLQSADGVLVASLKFSDDDDNVDEDYTIVLVKDLLKHYPQTTSTILIQLLQAIENTFTEPIELIEFDHSKLNQFPRIGWESSKSFSPKNILLTPDFVQSCLHPDATYFYESEYVIGPYRGKSHEAFYMWLGDFCSFFKKEDKTTSIKMPPRILKMKDEEAEPPINASSTPHSSAFSAEPLNPKKEISSELTVAASSSASESEAISSELVAAVESELKDSVLDTSSSAAVTIQNLKSDDGDLTEDDTLKRSSSVLSLTQQEYVPAADPSIFGSPKSLKKRKFPTVERNESFKRSCTEDDSSLLQSSSTSLQSSSTLLQSSSTSLPAECVEVSDSSILKISQALQNDLHQKLQFDITQKKLSKMIEISGISSEILSTIASLPFLPQPDLFQKIDTLYKQFILEKGSSSRQTKKLNALEYLLLTACQCIKTLYGIGMEFPDLGITFKDEEEKTEEKPITEIDL